MRQRPAQIRDRILLVHRFDLIEKRIDRVAQLRVHVQGQTSPGDLHRHAAPLRELIGLRTGGGGKHRVVQRRIDAFPERDVVDEAVTLEQRHARDLRNRSLDLLGRARRGATDAEGADRQTILHPPSPENIEHVAVAAHHAKRGEPSAVHVLYQRRRRGFEPVWRHPRKARGHRAGGRDVTADDSGRSPVGVAYDRPFDEIRRVRGTALDPEQLQGPTVQKDLVIRLLQRHRIVRGDLVELRARERPRVVRELRRGPAADVEDPGTRTRCPGTGPEHLNGPFSGFDSFPPQLQLPGVGGAQQVHMVVDEAGNDRPSAEVDSSGCRPGEPCDVSSGADGRDPVAPDGQRLRDREALVDRDDVRVDEDEIRRRLLRVQQRQRRRRSEPDRHGDRASRRASSHRSRRHVQPITGVTSDGAS